MYQDLMASTRPKLAALLDELEEHREREFRMKLIIQAYNKAEGTGPDAMIALLDIGRTLGVKVSLMGYEAPSTPRN